MFSPDTLSRPAPPIASLRLQEKVPFITAWSGETFASPRLARSDRRIGYASERPCERAAFGVLWRRMTNQSGQGKETVSYVSPRRGLVQAAQAVMRPDRYTLVDLESERRHSVSERAISRGRQCNFW